MCIRDRWEDSGAATGVVSGCGFAGTGCAGICGAADSREKGCEGTGEVVAREAGACGFSGTGAGCQDEERVWDTCPGEEDGAGRFLAADTSPDTCGIACGDTGGKERAFSLSIAGAICGSVGIAPGLCCSAW